MKKIKRFHLTGGMKKLSAVLLIFLLANTFVICGGCSNKKNNAANNPKMKTGANKDTAASNNNMSETKEGDSQTTQTDETKQAERPTENANAITKEKSVYDCDFAKDRAAFQADSVDITVGDGLYATQINDWYMYPEKYIGKTVEIEGYYLYFKPYDFVGRNGPSCPYCTGGYVCFEILSDQDLSGMKAEKDWIKVQGILREGFDSENGEFYYIEAINVEKMDKVGKTTVTD